MNTLKSVFEDAFRDIPIDAALVKKLRAFERRFVNKNEDHVAFFGGNLLGTPRMRWMPADTNMFFGDLLEIDDLALEENVHSLPDINPEWKRASNILNLSCAYLLHAIMHSDKLTAAQRQDGMTASMEIMLCKQLGSLMSNNWPFPPDPALAMAAYAELSRKFAIKRAGSWGKLIKERAEEICSARSVWRRTYERFDKDKVVGDFVADVHGRLKEIVKSYNEVFYRVKRQGDRIGTDQSFMDRGDGLEVLERTSNQAAFLHYIHEIIGDRNNFVKEELVRIVATQMHTMRPEFLIDTLEWVSDHHRRRGDKLVEPLVDEVMFYVFNLITTDRTNLSGRRGLTQLMPKLRALFMASRMADPTLLKTKALSEEIVRKAIKSRTDSVVASVRTGLQLYIVLRCLTKDHYSK